MSSRRSSARTAGLWAAGLLAGFNGGKLRAEPPAVPAVPAIAIIIDDVGNNLDQGAKAIALPGRVTLSVLPHTPHAARLAEGAHAAGKEVMLHLPMESDQRHRMGPGGLRREMGRAALQAEVRRNLDAIPHVAGLNNHMGSRLTADQEVMAWVMQSVAERGGLFYVDSRTAHDTVADRIAEACGVSNSARDLFLDNDRNPAEIRTQFEKLVKLARTKGYAIAIGHPHPETLSVLDQELPRLQSKGIRLVSASEIIHLQESTPWPEPSSPSRKVAKNSKP